MSPCIPKGGILSVVDNETILKRVEMSLADEGFQTSIIRPLNMLVGVFPEFKGQGIWQCDSGGIVFDVDLTPIPGASEYMPDKGEWKLNQGEILWTLYQQYGLDFLSKIRGAFAFVLWDYSNNRMVAVTDPIGIRSMVYKNSKSSFVAASRIKYMTQHLHADTTLNQDAIFHYLFFDAIPSPVTIYKGIRKLEPGNFLLYQDHKLTKGTYFDIEYKTEYKRKISQWLEDIPFEIRNAVEKHATISHPETTGCFLSGGTDSSSISGYYSQIISEPAKTFSIGFNDVDYNELDYAHIASKAFNTYQTDYFVTPGDVLSLVEMIPCIYDEPFGNSSVIPAYYCSKAAMDNGVDTLLGGDGGDEIFGGNERYAKNLIFELYHKIPQVIRLRAIEPLVQAFDNFPPIYRTGRYIRRSNLPNPVRFYSYNLLYENDASLVFNSEFLNQIDPDCFLNIAHQHYRHVNAEHVTDKLLYLDMKFTIGDNDLRKVTTMAEAAGVRVRYPMLDIDLVSFAATIPPHLKVKLGRERYIFKRAMKGFLPDEIIKKKKHGMGLPIANWFKTDRHLSQFLADHLFASNARITDYVRPDFIESMRNEFKMDNTPYYGSHFWVFLMLELWLRKNCN